MRRTNTFEVIPQSEQDEAVLRRLLDASASLWNQLTYARRQQFFAGESVWDCADYYDEYVDVLGSATTQHITRVNDAAWRSFFETVEEADQEVSPPGYWGNQADGRDLRTYIRNGAYTISWGEPSRLEVPIGSQLKDSTASVGPNGSGLRSAVSRTGRATSAGSTSPTTTSTRRIAPTSR